MFLENLNLAEGVRDHSNCYSSSRLDLTTVRASLRYADPDKWTEDVLDSAEHRYRNYLDLRARFQRAPLVPTKLVDSFWHAHILDTVAYHRDCDSIFGYYLHHDPLFGVGSNDAMIRLKVAFDQTCALYKDCFGSDFQDDQLSSAVACASGCSGCSSVCQ